VATRVGLKRAGGCLHCGSLDWEEKRGARYCRDCGAVFRPGELLRAGFIDLHYSLDVRDDGGRSLWCETLDVLFEAQCDIAQGLKIKPGSSFTKWLKSRERTEGVIDDAATIAAMEKIAGKLVAYGDLIREEYNLDAARRLVKALAQATRLVLTLTQR
jgi:hypothetical protein